MISGSGYDPWLHLASQAENSMSHGTEIERKSTKEKDVKIPSGKLVKIRGLVQAETRDLQYFWHKQKQQYT